MHFDDSSVFSASLEPLIEAVREHRLETGQTLDQAIRVISGRYMLLRMEESALRAYFSKPGMR